MLSGSALCRLAAFGLLAWSSCLTAQFYDLDRGRESIVSLDGSWRFHAGDSPLASSSASPLWADPNLDDSGWEILQSNTSWAAQGHPAMSGYAWYRFKVAIPANEKPASLLLAPIATSYAVYVDGKLAGVCGDFPPEMVPSTEFSFHLFPLTSTATTTQRIVQVALRVWHSPMWADYVGGGPNQGGHLAGDSTLLAREKIHHQLTRDTSFVDAYSYSITSALVGVAIFCLFLFHPAEREFLWFSLILLAQSADNVLFVAQQIFFWPSAPIYDLLDGIFVAVAICATLFFVSRVLRSPLSKVGVGVLALATCSPLAAVLYWPGWFSAPESGTIQIICLLPSVTWILVILLARTWQGDLNARLLFLPAGLDLGFYFADNLAIVFGQAGWISNPRVLELNLAIPPFKVQIGILFHLVFLLALLVFLIRRFALASRREQRLAGELEAARQVQQVLLPDELDQCPGFVVECTYKPADQVGGDFFQQIGDGNGGMLIVVGDVSGKGLPAAMLVSVLVGAIRAEASHGTHPATVLRSLNDRMFGRSRNGFTTCLAGHITVEGHITLANAGHLAPYLNGKEIAVPSSLPLGLVPQCQCESISMALYPGDRLTFVSDGVVEARSKSGELFGFERTRQISCEPAEVIAQAAQSFGQEDDITVVTVEFTGVAQELSVSRA
jgi:sigma-B regulation protein RsbU (phosphoserine phosphatase)